MFLSECRELIRWADDIESRITADELATDVAGAEMLVDRHQEHRVSLEQWFSTTVFRAACGPHAPPSTLCAALSSLSMKPLIVCVTDFVLL